MLAGLDERLEILGSRRPRGDEHVLADLVLPAADARLLVGHLGEDLGVVEHRAPDRGNDRLPSVRTDLLIRRECPIGGVDCQIERGMDPLTQLGVGDLHGHPRLLRG